MLKRLFTRLLAAVRPAPRQPDQLLAMLSASGTLEPPYIAPPHCGNALSVRSVGQSRRPAYAAADFADTQPLPELSDYAQFERATRP